MADTNPIVKTKLASLRFPLTMIARLRREGKFRGIGWQVLTKEFLTKSLDQAEEQRAMQRAMQLALTMKKSDKIGKFKNRGG